jgi:hypothetical protein
LPSDRVASESAEHRPGAGKAPVARALDREFARKGESPGIRDRPPAEARGALPCLVRAQGRFAVDQKPHHGFARVLAHERREESRRIAVAAGARVVLRVGKHDWHTGLAARHGALDCIIRKMQLECEVAFRIGNRCAQLLDRRVHVLLARAIAEYRHAAFVEIGHRKTGREREHGVG